MLVTAGERLKSSILKNNFRAPIRAFDQPQLLAAARVTSILLHSNFSRGKNLEILFLKVWFEIFRRDTTLYLAAVCEAKNRKMGRKSVSPV